MSGDETRTDSYVFDNLSCTTGTNSLLFTILKTFIMQSDETLSISLYSTNNFFFLLYIISLNRKHFDKNFNRKKIRNRFYPQLFFQIQISTYQHYLYKFTQMYNYHSEIKRYENGNSKMALGCSEPHVTDL